MVGKWYKTSRWSFLRNDKDIYIYIDKFRFEMVGQDNIFQDGIYDDCLVLIEYACETAAMIL